MAARHRPRRALVVCLLAVLLLPLPGGADPAAAADPAWPAWPPGGGGASISLTAASMGVTQTSDTSWTLSKTGLVDPASSTVTWQITATEGATVGGHLVINGTMTVTNSGAGPATIGNIVVNLQKKVDWNWVTQSSDIADATNDDAATTAKIFSQASSEGKSSFTENSASGHLRFMDTATNTIFALVPQVTIPGGQTRTLLFSTAFDNNVLHLAAGTAIRAETIVSFGNAVTSSATAPNIDINGNGIIDTDEKRVRSVPSRLTLTVPAQTAGNLNVTLSDTLADITSTGTATFSNAAFNLGATSGTVTVHYDGGTDGGMITNCAHLTGSSQNVIIGGFQFPNVVGVDLTACDTQMIGAHMCTPGAAGCGWMDGDMVSYGQDAWDTGAANTVLFTNFGAVYGASFGVEVGIKGAAGFSMLFDSAQAVVDYVPATGPIGPLTADLVDPTTTSSGPFGGDVLALQIDVDFSDAGVLGGNSGLKLGDLTICALPVLTAVNGMTVRQFLAAANTSLGGGSSVYAADAMDLIASDISNAFGDGAASSYAQAHLVNGPCP